MATAFKVGPVMFTGAGLLAGKLPDGRPCVYYGGLTRIADPDRSNNTRDLFEQFAMTAIAGADGLRSRRDYKPAEGAPIELTGCYDDATTGDVILMWRIACVEIAATERGA